MIPVSGKVYDQDEIDLGQEAVRDGWWTEGKFARQFETKLRSVVSRRYVHLANSGSSANLLAVAALTSRVFGERQLKPGDEFITTATGFPTTVNPGILYGLTPVFVDVDKKTLNADISAIQKAITPQTKLIMIAHTLGNPFDISVLKKLADEHHLWFIEDCCDALGSRFADKPVGVNSHISTYSFYPAHHITTGEGGAVTTDSPLISRAIEQFRDWGRDCWCEPGKDNTCGKRFEWQLGDLPTGYDHKYIYSQIGYNLKMTDMQAAIGVAQLDKLPFFIKKRKENYRQLYDCFKKQRQWFDLAEVHPKAEPSWFGFPFAVKKNAPFTRDEFTKFLEEHCIATRPLFAGNLIKHPAYMDIPKKIVDDLDDADYVMNAGAWIGVYPGIDAVRLKYILKIVETFMNLKSKS